MTFRAAPGLLAGLDWFFNEAPGAIAGLRSSWRDDVAVEQSKTPTHLRVRLRIRTADGWKTVLEDVDAAPLRCGPIYVPKEQHYQAVHELGGRAFTAAEREAPILDALRFVGADVFDALRFRFREKLLVCKAHVPEYLWPFIHWGKGCRVPFGLEGATGRRGNEFDGCLGVMLNPLRGCGAAAHLTTAARAAYAKDRLRLRVRLDVGAWVDRLGGRICARGEAVEATGPDQATDAELDLGRELRRQAEALIYGERGALHEYSRVLLRRRTG